MKVYVHVHRADRPGKCYWLCIEDGVCGLHPEFMMASVIDDDKFLSVSQKLADQFGVPLGTSTVHAVATELIPPKLRSLLKL